MTKRASLVTGRQCPGLLTRHVPGVFYSPAPDALPNGRNKLEMDRFSSHKSRWSGGRDSNSRSPGPKPNPVAYRT